MSKHQAKSTTNAPASHALASLALASHVLASHALATQALASHCFFGESRTTYFFPRFTDLYLSCCIEVVAAAAKPFCLSKHQVSLIIVVVYIKPMLKSTRPNAVYQNQAQQDT